MSEVDKLKKKKELKSEILKTLTNMNCILSEIEDQIDCLQNETKPSGELAVDEEQVWESFQPIFEALGVQVDPC